MPVSLEAIAAFLSGVGAVLGGWRALTGVRRRAEERCNERIREIREAYDRGLREGLHLKEDE